MCSVARQLLDARRMERSLSIWEVVGVAVPLLGLGACVTQTNDPCASAKPGEACRWAGTGERGFNAANPTAGRTEARLYFPMDLTFGPDGRAYIADWNNHMIRRVEQDQSLRVVVGTDYEGDGPPEMEDRLPVCNPKGALGTTVALNHPSEVRFGPDGLLYISAWHNNKIRVLDTVTGMVKTIAGDFYGYSGDNGPACAAVFNQPKSIDFDPDGTIYTVDQRNVRIRKITPPPERIVTTIAGTGVLGNAGDGGQAIDAQFGFETTATPRPSGALVKQGNVLYLADSMNNRIRRIHLDSGIIDCIAGQSAEAGYSGDGGPATAATFNFPMDLELGPDGRLYVADRYNNAIRAIDLTSGIVETVAGGTSCKTEKETCPDRAPAKEIGLNQPYGIAFDGDGNLFIADTENSRILEVVKP
jgi:sugar lactone lactonase YvrE